MSAMSMMRLQVVFMLLISLASAAPNDTNHDHNTTGSEKLYIKEYADHLLGAWNKFHLWTKPTTTTTTTTTTTSTTTPPTTTTTTSTKPTPISPPIIINNIHPTSDDINGKWCEPNCSCGIANKSGRISGGTPTTVENHPWMAILMEGEKIRCGGTLINDRYVLTAARCVHGVSHVTESVTVVLGKPNKAETSRSETAISIDSVLVHPGYSDGMFIDHDVALLKLSQNVKLHRSARPICLPGGDYTGKSANVTGWSGDKNSNLLQTEVKVMKLEECKPKYFDDISENMMCTDSGSEKELLLKGDSGGPLMINNEFNQKVIIGVVSRGDKQIPEILYERVDKHLDWIRKHTQDACYC